MANKTIQLSDGSNNLYSTIYRTYANGSQSVPNNTNTTFTNKITIGSGTWMIVAYVGWSTSSTSAYNINIYFNTSRQRTIRASMLNGGGAVNTVIFTTSSSGTVSVEAWQNSGSASTATYWIDAIKLS